MQGHIWIYCAIFLGVYVLDRRYRSCVCACLGRIVWLKDAPICMPNCEKWFPSTVTPPTCFVEVIFSPFQNWDCECQPILIKLIPISYIALIISKIVDSNSFPRAVVNWANNCRMFSPLFFQITKHRSPVQEAERGGGMQS